VEDSRRARVHRSQGHGYLSAGLGGARNGRAHRRKPHTGEIGWGSSVMGMVQLGSRRKRRNDDALFSGAQPSKRSGRAALKISPGVLLPSESAPTIPTRLNLFMNVEVVSNGTLSILPLRSHARQHHVKSGNGYDRRFNSLFGGALDHACKPIHYANWRWFG
jgi:hypothetical protein